MCFVTLYEYYLCLYYIDVKTEAQKNEGSLHSSLISKSKLFLLYHIAFQLSRFAFLYHAFKDSVPVRRQQEYVYTGR